MERSLLFANLASIAYNEPEVAKKQARKLGFTTFEFYNRDGAQAYRFQNKSDLVIACRGTQPTELQDLGADMRAFPVVAETVSRVHKGFKKEVDDLWPMISEDIDRTANLKKDLWFCGHSLGAAMATIMASRCMFTESLGNPVELYTFGSPRVGWKGYCNSLGVGRITMISLHQYHLDLWDSSIMVQSITSMLMAIFVIRQVGRESKTKFVVFGKVYVKAI